MAKQCSSLSYFFLLVLIVVADISLLAACSRCWDMTEEKVEIYDYKQVGTYMLQVVFCLFG